MTKSEAIKKLIKAIEDDAPRQPWFVLEALANYYSAEKDVKKDRALVTNGLGALSELAPNSNQSGKENK